MISIYQFGTFDVANFGDLLFPLLAQKRLAPLNAKIVAVSPIGAPPVWEDCIPSVGIDEIMNISDKPSGVLIGGGNILTLMPTKLPAYNRGSVPLLGYPDIWIGASCLASENVPVCWNAPGVPTAFSSEQHPFVRDCIDRSSYVSVRDEQSRNFLLEVCPNSKISVVPDPAWEISNLWTSNQLEETYEKMFNNCGEKRPPRSISIHLNSRYMASVSNQTVAGCLDKIARKFEARIVLLAIGPCHGDDKLALLVGGYMKTFPLIIDQPNSLKEIASCIANSVAYIGSSMHGLITASSFCVPGICVTFGEKPKFQGLREQFGHEDIWSQSWETIPEQLLSLNMDQKKIQLRELRQRMQERVDQHWEQIKAIIKEYSQNFGDMAGRIVNASYKANKRFFSYRANFAAIEAIKNIRLYDQTKSEISQNNHYREELYSVYTSRSWRYTAPARKIGNFVRRMLASLHRPPVRTVIKRAYFVMPAFIRKSRLIKNLKRRFKSKEVSC